VQRIVCDSNVIISAFPIGGKPMAVLQQAIDGEIKLFYSQPIFDETRRILCDKFGYSLARLDEINNILEVCGVKVTPVERLNVVPSDGGAEPKSLSPSAAEGTPGGAYRAHAVWSSFN
jgi:predicted nucleic acid-binding protein